MGFNIDPSLDGYTPERSKIFYQQLTDSLSAIPGVRSVGLASVRILEDNEWDSGMTVEGYNPARPDDHAQPFMNLIGPNYFATLGVPIVAGRDFTAQDNREVKKGPQPDDWTPTAVMINEKFARRYFPGQNPSAAVSDSGPIPEREPPWRLSAWRRTSSTRICVTTSQSRHLFPIPGVTSLGA